MPRIEAWNAENLRNSQAGKPLVIVGCGPSYDAVPRDFYADKAVLALNAAITEFRDHPDCLWACHDLFKMLRGGFRARIARLKTWRLITRRVYLPGRAGEVPYRAVDGGTIRAPFAWRIPPADLRHTDLWWYSELPDQEGYLRADETTLEVALAVASWWGFSPISLVGFDLAIADRARPYGRPWGWKKCFLRSDKLARMRRVLTERRHEWSDDITIIGPAWKGCPFEKATSQALPSF